MACKRMLAVVNLADQISCSARLYPSYSKTSILSITFQFSNRFSGEPDSRASVCILLSDPADLHFPFTRRRRSRQITIRVR